jgi:long-chain acyl-CoA synthetase
MEAGHLFGFVVVITFDMGLVTFPRFCFSDSEAVLIYVSPQKVDHLSVLLSSPLPCLRYLVVNDEIDGWDEWSGSARIQLLFYDEFLGMNHLAVLPALAPEEPCAICYSSGTIGAPKGVVISHAAMMNGIWTIACSVNVTSDMLHVSHLPLAHILERLTTLVIMYRRGRIVFASSGSKGAFIDMSRVGATGGAIIPKMMNSLDSLVMGKVNKSRITSALMKFSLGLSKVSRFFGFRSRVADLVLLKRMRQCLGGRIEWFVVAGEPFAADVHERLSIIFNMDLITIYGLSECGGAVSVTDRRAIAPGTVGKVVPGTQILLSDNMEIFIRSNAMFSTYHNQPEIFTKSFQDGWFRSGDKGRLDLAGNLIVPGRAFDVLEYEPGVELAIPFLVVAYSRHRVINDIFIHPFPEERAFIAVAVTECQWIEWAYKTKLLDPSHAEVYCAHPQFYQWVRKYLRVHARQENLPSSAYIAAIRCTTFPFSADGTLWTQTGKQRPAAFQRKFAAWIEEMKQEVITRHRQKGLTGSFVEYEDEQD